MEKIQDLMETYYEQFEEVIPNKGEDMPLE